MMEPISLDERVEARVLYKSRLCLTPQCSTSSSGFVCVANSSVCVANITAFAPAKPSWMAIVRISLRRTEDIFKTLSNTLRLQVATKEPLCHD